jgi:Heavy-metal resistance protein CzcE
MKLKLIAPAALALTLGLANWSASAASLLYGDVVPTADAARTIVITPDTKWVDATDMETVKFISNGQEFAVDFDGVRSEFPLNAIAPAGALDHIVKAYVHPAPGENAGG